jgi:hypothetical protein
VHEAGRLAEHQHLARLLRFGRRRRRQGCDHRLDVLRLRRLVLRTSPSAESAAGAAGAGIAAVSPVAICSWPSVPALAVSHSVNHRSNVARISSRVVAPSLLASTAVKNPAAAAPPPRPPRPPAYRAAVAAPIQARRRTPQTGRQQTTPSNTSDPFRPPEKRATCYECYGATCLKRATCDVRRATCDVRRATCCLRAKRCLRAKGFPKRDAPCTWHVARGTWHVHIAHSTSHVQHVAPVARSTFSTSLVRGERPNPGSTPTSPAPAAGR